MTPLLAVEGLTIRFGAATVLHDVSLQVAHGECLGLVGESGAGKSLTLLAALGLLPAGARVSGSIRLHGTEVIGASRAVLRRLRGTAAGIVFQDPLQTFNPFLTIGRQLTEVLTTHRSVGRVAARAAACAMLTRVALSEPAQRLRQHPHALSGGMRQRAAIAMALLAEPGLLLADEPTTALDASVQGQVLDLLATLRAQLGLGLVVVSHNLGVVGRLADRVAVMYAGRIVEAGPATEVLRQPAHPYTVALIAAVPRLDAERRLPMPIPGEPPPPGLVPKGCAFRPRCARAAPACVDSDPALRSGRTGLIACHHPLPA
jgi:oligopeptide/dipeptide ABC transporter ATP-binding protein